MARSRLESEKLYDEMKFFFYTEDEYDFVVEITSGPMGDWPLTYFLSNWQMGDIRRRIADEKGAYAGFINEDGEYFYYFYDENMFKVQSLNNDEVILFEDNQFNTFTKEKVIAELLELKKSLQGS